MKDIAEAPNGFLTYVQKEAEEIVKAHGFEDVNGKFRPVPHLTLAQV
jgi:hypothetical protein